MKVIRKNRELLVYRTNGPLLFQFERGGAGAWPDNGFVTRLNFGRGAGYKGGRTLFFAVNSYSRSYSMREGWLAVRIGRVEFGFTRNANIIPFLGH